MSLAHLLGERITSIAQRQGVSLAALARSTGVPRTTLNRLVSSEGGNPGLETLEKLAGALGVTVSQLLDNAPEKGSDPLVGNDGLPAGENGRHKAFIADFTAASAKGQIQSGDVELLACVLAHCIQLNERYIVSK